MYKITFFVPPEFAEIVKQAMFLAGAGKIGQYENCSFESLGVGQFKPLTGANPAIGKVDEIVKVQELKIEMVCEEALIYDIISAMKKNHPYELPAYDIIKCENF